MKTWKMYIDDAWIEARDGRSYSLPNPATEEDVALAPDADVVDVERAVAAARRAFDEGPWPRTPVAERVAVLHRIADGIESRKEEFRDTVVRAHGAAALTHGQQVDAPIQLIRNYAELARGYAFEEMLPLIDPPTGGNLVSTLVVRQPVGVCALIPTWNFPLWVTAQKFAPALAAGCTMVVKPSPWGPLIDLMLAEVVAEAGVPPGVFNVVSGQSPEIGRALVEDPRIDMVSFTGSNGVGKRIMECAAKNLTKVHLELGGKSALIVLDDYDLDAAVLSGCVPTFFHAGQGCAMTTRVLVSRSRHDDLVTKMTDFVEKNVKIGDPADPSILLGPVIRPERRAAIEDHIASARDEGADLATGGGRPAGLERGWFVEPTIFANVRNDMRIAREEVFGPVVSVLPFDEEEDAVRIANDSEYGLFGGILTQDKRRAIDMARRIRTGGVAINGAVNSFSKPSGGFKQSGLGRENGAYGIDEYTEYQAVMWPS
ncbi:MAG: aldehyde dehydrogenase family protein [Candidatus Binatia bacterium]|nr:aldehyde dehydrogenase family protein [Candidatus Binatia bacterium]